MQTVFFEENCSQSYYLLFLESVRGERFNYISGGVLACEGS